MDEAEFIRRCVRKEKQAWDEFVNRYSGLIYTYIRHTLRLKGMHSQREESTGELFQEIIFSLVKDDCRKLRSFKGINGCSLASWLRLLAINMTIDHVRKMRFLQSKAPIDKQEAEDLLMTYSQGESGFHEIMENELRQSLSECIEKLKAEEKYFMELHINQELRLEEIRGFLKLSRGMVDMRKSRIIAKLKECFKNKGFELPMEE